VEEGGATNLLRIDTHDTHQFQKVQQERFGNSFQDQRAIGMLSAGAGGGC